MSKDNRPALDITVETVSANGTYRLDPNDRDPGNRPLGINWRTKLGEGFSDGGYSVNRPVDEDFHDLNLADISRFIDADGNVLYEGYQAGQPRDLDSMHSIGVTLAGPVVNAKRRKFREIYVDRTFDRFGEVSTARKAGEFVAGRSLGKVSEATAKDGLVWTPPNEAIANLEETEVMYDAGPNLVVASFAYRGKQTGSMTGFETANLYADDSDTFPAFQTVALTLDDTVRTATITTPARFLMMRTLVTAGPVTPPAGTSRQISKWAAYGNHGLTTYEPLTAGEPNGVRLTDAVVDIITRFCPGLDPSDIPDFDYVVPHLVYSDRTWPYDALLDLNKYLLWKFCVWEGGRVQYEPHDLTDYTWQIRTDDPNVTFSWVGPTTENIANGIAVTYTDLLTGRREEITPETTPELSDTDPENPFNRAGVQQWYEIDLSTPQLEDGAVLMGIAALGEYNRPKAPGTFTIRGHIRDREGNWQPAGHVRAGDTIAITNHPNDAPRLIVETDYQHDQQQLRVSVDAPFNLIEAQMDRLSVELESLGLSG